MAKKKDKSDAPAPRAVNKKAYHNFEIVEKVEAGVALVGTEVKSLRDAGADLDSSFARIIRNECWLVGCKIAPYVNADDAANHDPQRNRKLLLHKKQIAKLTVKLEQRGFTLIPLKFYFNSRGLAKMELALARGKRQYDKRKTIAERTQKRDLDRDMKKYR